MARLNKGSWCVHSTVHEPVEVLCAFVAHYLEMGASEVHLFLDQPNDDVVDILGKVPGVRLTLCDQAYWAATTAGTRPDGQVRRQTMNANRAYAECKQDWFLFVDADEFIHTTGKFSDLLAAIKRPVGFAKIGVAERAYAVGQPPQSLFDAAFFRCPIDPEQVDMTALYGDQAELFPRGLLGHARGKSVVRTGLPYDLHIHFPVNRNSKQDRRKQQNAALAAEDLAGVKLLHFDGLTPLHWLIKLLKRHDYVQKSGNFPFKKVRGVVSFLRWLKAWFKRRFDSLRSRNSSTRNFVRLVRKRQLQTQEAFTARNDPERLRRLSGAQFIDPETAAKLREIGGLIDATPDIEGAARRMFGALSLDYSVEAFDARLKAQNEALLAKVALGDFDA